MKWGGKRKWGGWVEKGLLRKLLTDWNWQLAMAPSGELALEQHQRQACLTQPELD